MIQEGATGGGEEEKALAPARLDLDFPVSTVYRPLNRSSLLSALSNRFYPGGPLVIGEQPRSSRSEVIHAEDPRCRKRRLASSNGDAAGRNRTEILYN